MKFLAGLIVLFALTSATAHFENLPPELYEWGDEYVWSVKRYSEGNPRKPQGFVGHGSGVWLDDTRMVTACHVPSNHKEMWASANGHPEINVEMVVEFCHRWKDQAVMSVVKGEHRSAPVTFGDLPRRGERVYIIGYPADSPLTVTTGWFVGKTVRTLAADNSEWILYADAMGGNSGGAVVGIREGQTQLIGILVSGYSKGSHRSDERLKLDPCLVGDSTLLTSFICLCHFTYHEASFKVLVGERGTACFIFK